MAFIGNLTGTGVTSANNQGLYAGLPGGVVEIVRTGDMIDEGNGSGLHTVSGIMLASGSGGGDGQGLALSDSGNIVYGLTFTDGTSGVFTSAIPVPEPGTLRAGRSGVGGNLSAAPPARRYPHHGYRMPQTRQVAS